jgi:hypothetical protein
LCSSNPNNSTAADNFSLVFAIKQVLGDTIVYITTILLGMIAFTLQVSSTVV